MIDLDFEARVAVLRDAQKPSGPTERYDATVRARSWLRTTTGVDPNQPHRYQSRPGQLQFFNLDAPRPCRWCGREPSSYIHMV